MNIVIASDSFKGSLTSIQVGEAIKKGIELANIDATVNIRPLADGGEGTVEALVTGMNGKFVTKEVTGPVGTKVMAQYGIIEKRNLAIIEMSAAAGITLVSEEEKNPLYTTTFGVGELIKDAIEKGCTHFIVGIGGSATNDGGVGMLQALGYDFLDKDGNQITRGAIGLKDLVEIKADNVLPALKNVTFNVACDVNNPLYGPTGSSAVYGPQKGATPEMVKDMDSWLKNYAEVAQELYENADPLYPGTGAAGGLGFAFKAFTNGELQSGIKIILEETHLENYIKEADLVVTGEGRLDFQTAMGKAPIGVANLAKNHNKPVIAFCGSASADASENNKHGIDAFFTILNEITTLQQAMDYDYAFQALTNTAQQVFRLYNINK